MRLEGRYVAGLGGLLVGWQSLLLVWSSDWLSHLLFALSAFGALVVGGLARAGGGHAGERRDVPDLSLGTGVLAVGVTLALVGAAVGGWLALVGLEVAAFGALVLRRETRMRSAG